MKVIQLTKNNEVIKEFKNSNEYTQYLRDGLVGENEFVKIINK